MARTDTLGNFLTDVAEAIRTKEGTTETITASEFDTRIANLSGGGDKYAPRYISFYGYTGTELDEELANLDTHNITSMSNMFYNCTGVTTLDVSKFDTSNVTSMGSMFQGCSKVTELDLSGWDTSKLTYIRMMFNGCNKLTTINLGDFNTANVSDMSYLFNRCSSLTELDLSSFDLSNVSSFQEMLYNATSLASFSFSNKMRSSTSLKQTFQYCSALTAIDMSSVTTVSDWYGTFTGCTSLQSIDMRSVDMSSSVPTSYTFNNVPAACEIIVKDETTRETLLGIRSDFTNIKTVAELTTE